MVRKAVITLMVVLVFGMAFGAYFKDVPKNHWAYKAVVALSKLGILSGYPDDTFKGEQMVSRYQLAYALYKMVIYMQEYVSDEVPNVSALKMEVAKISDMAAKAYKWANENSSEIANLRAEIENLKTMKTTEGTDVSDILSEIASLKMNFDQKLQNFDVKMSRIYQDLQRKVEEIKGYVDEKMGGVELEELGELKRDVDALKGIAIDMYVFKKNLVDFESSLTSLEATTVQFESDLQEIKESYKELNGELESLSTELASSLQFVKVCLTKTGSRVAVVEATVTGLTDRLGKLEERVDKDFSEVRKDIEDLYKKPSSTMGLCILSYLFSILLFGVSIYFALSR